MIGYSEQEFNEKKNILLITPKRTLFLSKEEILKKYNYEEKFSNQLHSLLCNNIKFFISSRKATVRLATKEELKKEYEIRLEEDGSRAEIKAYTESHEYDHVAPTLKKYGNIYVGDIDDRITKQVSTICDNYSIRPTSDRMGYIITIPSQYVENGIIEEGEKEEYDI